MKKIDLGLTGKACIWQDETLYFPGDSRPIFYPVVDENIEVIFDNVKIGSLQSYLKTAKTKTFWRSR